MLSEKHVFNARPPCCAVAASFSVFSSQSKFVPARSPDVTYSSTQQHTEFISHCTNQAAFPPRSVNEWK